MEVDRMANRKQEEYERAVLWKVIKKLLEIIVNMEWWSEGKFHDKNEHRDPKSRFTLYSMIVATSSYFSNVFMFQDISIKAF